MHKNKKSIKNPTLSTGLKFPIYEQTTKFVPVSEPALLPKALGAFNLEPDSEVFPRNTRETANTKENANTVA